MKIQFQTTTHRKHNAIERAFAAYELGKISRADYCSCVHYLMTLGNAHI
ncbi:hypothetical protein RSX24_031825 [Paenibacillus sp. ES5-4]